MAGSNTVALVMYLVFYIFLILLFILWMYSIICRCHQFRIPRLTGDRNTVMRPAIVLFTTNQQLGQLPRGLEESMIETFPKFSFMDTDMDMDMNTKMKMTGECVVCLGIYQENETLRLLPKCGHVFHADCVDIWLRSHSTCPFCRANLLANGEPVTEMSRGHEVRVNVVDTRNSDVVVP